MYNRAGIWQSPSTTEAPGAAFAPRGDLKIVPSEGGDDAPRYLCVPLDVIPVDLPLPCALYVRISDKFVLFRKAGDVLTQARATSLAAPSGGVMFVDLAEWNQLLHSLEAIAIATSLASQAPETPAAEGLKIRNLLFAYARELEQKQNFTAELLGRIEKLANQLAQLVLKSPSTTPGLLRRYQDPALYHINHAINVAIYSLAIAHKQKLSLQEMKLLAFAALVHNVGNRMVPAQLLFKPGELTVDEKNTIDTHILHGATLLQNLAAPKDVILTAMQHHDRYDGQGLTGRQGGNDIHLFARICSIADVFDAITNYRPYHMLPMSPEDAIRRMTDMRGKFDPTILPMVTP